MTIDWSNPTVQVAAIGVAGVVLAALFAGIFGAVGAMVAGRISASATRDAARAASSAEAAARAEGRQDRLDEIQRATLLELQEALAEWMRAETKIHLADIDSLKKHGKLFLLPDGIADEEFAAGRRFIYLTERVRDDGLRTALTGLRAKGAELEARRAILHEAATVESTEQDMFGLGEAGVAVSQQLGVVLRTFL